MRYCKKCGAELPEKAAFCEKCGSPVGKAAKQGDNRKKWVFAISFGVIILAAAIVGGLYVTDTFWGEKGEPVRVDVNHTVQATPSVGEEAVESRENPQEDNQKDALNDGNTEDMVWEAFEAYKTKIDDERDGWDEEALMASYDSSHHFALIYLDDDNYPELLVCQTAVRPADGIIYTYRGEGIEEAGNFAGTTIAYQEKTGYIYSRGWYTCDWTECMDLYDGDSFRSLFNNTISDSNYENNYYGVEKVAQLVGVDTNGEWITIDTEDSSNGSDIVWGENMDEAYIRLLDRNKSNQ